MTSELARDLREIPEPLRKSLGDAWLKNESNRSTRESPVRHGFTALTRIDDGGNPENYVCTCYVSCSSVVLGQPDENMYVPPQLLHQLPLLAIFVVPVTSAYFGLTKINMKSAIHFQQVLTLRLQISYSACVAFLRFFACGLTRRLTGRLSGRRHQRLISMASSTDDEHADDTVVRILVPSDAWTVSYGLSAGILAGYCGGVLFSGWNSSLRAVAESVCLSTATCILFGAGVFLVFGIKDVTSFRTIIPYEFTISDSILSLCVGFVVSLYQLTSSPLQYQQTVPHPALAYAVIVSFLSVFTFCIQWLYMCITTHVWEEFVKTHLRDLGSMKQLCCLQSILLLICAISVTIVSAIRFLQLPYDFLTPTVTLTVLSFNMEKVVLMASHMPLHSHPIVAFVMSILICPIVSLFTGGQDQMSLDWNLVVVPGSLGRGSTYSKRPFVESESFRYAQHTAGPGLLKHQR
ncbi:hypothetical protein ANCCEY_07492 [Ancylostoma ceylanicum]|uniref:Uncharacterized protein n=1 Tax=Ancylostoma ceylanicum TaxID=53326 RepID=A0A0D6LTQ3_9BILA|nr:hypothetical protein ANCCEY_07492 [Ancylostoma ceylanicum]